MIARDDWTHKIKKKTVSEMVKKRFIVKKKHGRFNCRFLLVLYLVLYSLSLSYLPRASQLVSLLFIGTFWLLIFIWLLNFLFLFLIKEIKKKRILWYKMEFCRRFLVMCAHMFYLWKFIINVWLLCLPLFYRISIFLSLELLSC